MTLVKEKGLGIDYPPQNINKVQTRISSYN